MIHAEIIDQDGLTDKEAKVLKLLCEGCHDKTIAAKLAMSIKTVDSHCGHIYSKLDVQQKQINCRCAAIAEAVARGMVRLSRSVLCVLLMVAAVNFDDSAVRAPRVRVSGRSVSTRSKD